MLWDYYATQQSTIYDLFCGRQLESESFLPGSPNFR